MLETILAAQNLTKYYPFGGRAFLLRRGLVRAVEGVSLDILSGQTLGLVGESGCGKSTLGRVLLRLEEPTAGCVLFHGENVASFKSPRLKAFRRQAQIIYQDPYSALNPRKKIGNLVEEPLIIHQIGKHKKRKEIVAQFLEMVGLTPEHSQRYPHEFSGGQRQRIVIARALVLQPELIVADEPVSALDVSIQAQIINLLIKLQANLGLTYIFITHDLSVVEYISDRVAVMYLGRIVEVAPKEIFFQSCRHPYSKALLSAVPVPDPNPSRKRILLRGDVPSPINPPAGCRFHPRCSVCQDICCQQEPSLSYIGDEHWVACHVYSVGSGKNNN